MYDEDVVGALGYDNRFPDAHVLEFIDGIRVCCYFECFWGIHEDAAIVRHHRKSGADLSVHERERVVAPLVSDDEVAVLVDMRQGKDGLHSRRRLAPRPLAECAADRDLVRVELVFVQGKTQLHVDYGTEQAVEFPAISVVSFFEQGRQGVCDFLDSCLDGLGHNSSLGILMRFGKINCVNIIPYFMILSIFV